MIISTSSHNVLLTDDICAYVESCMCKSFGRLADRVMSVDARLEAVRRTRDRNKMRVAVRVDLRDHRTLVTEISDDNLYAAIRRGANDSARSTGRLLQRSREVVGRRPGKAISFDRYSTANI
jgi:ribosomal subunit interface protein